MKNIFIPLVLLGVIMLILIGGCVSENNTNNATNAYPAIIPYANVNVSAENYRDSNGLTAVEKAEVVRILFNDPIAKDLITRPNATCDMGNISIFNGSDPNQGIGYIRPSMRLAICYLSIQIKEKLLDGSYSYIGMYDQVLGIVDPENKTCMQLMVKDFRGDPRYGYIILPPGSSSYMPLSLFFGIFYAKLNIEPQDARIYPLVLNRTNFLNYMDDKPYNAHENLDEINHQVYYYDGNAPISQGKTVFINANNEMVYFILTNKNGAGEAKINLTF